MVPSPFLSTGALQVLHPVHTPTQFLRHLELNKCGIPEAGGLEIAAALAANSTLESLHMAHNALSDKTAAAIGTALQDNRVLKTLDLSWNRIQVRGCTA